MSSHNPGFFDRKIRPERSEGSLGQIRRESGLISEVSQILLPHKKIRRKNPGYPAKTAQNPFGVFRGGPSAPRNCLPGGRQFQGLSPEEFFKFLRGKFCLPHQSEASKIWDNLVFLHGWGTSPRVWEKQIAHFSKKYKVETVDLYPLMSCPRKRASKNGFYMDSRLRGNDSNVPILIGWSYGGMLAMDCAVKNPDKIKALVLVGCSAKFTEGMPPAAIRNIKRNLNKNFKTTMENCYATFFLKSEEATMKKFIENQNLPDKKDTIDILDQLLVLDQRHILKDIKSPTLVVHGDKDAVCPLEGARSLHEGIRGSRLSIIKDAGHAPFYAKAEEFNKILKEFLETLD